MLEKTKLMKLKDKVQLLEADHPDILDENDEFPSGTDLTLNGTGDLPMEVDVGGNSTQETTTGKNWLDLSGFISKEVNGLTFSYQNGKLKINGTANALIDVYIGNSTWNANADTLKSILNAKNTTYYLSSTSNKISNYYWSTTNGYVENSVTTTDSNKISTIFVRIANGTTFNNELIGFQIEENSSATSWEKYTGGTASPNPTYKQDINNVEGDVVVKGSSKNFWKFPKIFFTTNNTSWFDSSGVEVTSVNAFNNSSYKITLKEGTYYFKSHNPINNDFIQLITVINNTLSVVGTNNEGSFTLTEETTILPRIKANTANTLTTLGDLQIEKGTVATSYVPFGENSVTFPLSQGQKLMLGDTLEDDGIHHKRGQYVFTGNENWVLDTNRTSELKTIFYLQNATTLLGIKPITSSYQLGNLLLEKFIEVIQAGSWNIGQISMRVGDTNIYFIVEPNTTLEQFKELITGSVFEYPLAEETIDPYTSAQQTAYNKLKEMQSYYDLTYVVGSSNNAQPILTVQAKKSLKVMQSEIDELKQAILNS